MPTEPASHRYEFGTRSALRVLAGPLAGAAIGILALHLGSWARLLPSPVPADLDHTILQAKARLALQSEDAELILLGDSSCMMNLDARALGERLGTSVINLGTLSYLDLTSHARLLREFVAQHPPRPRRIVLLMNPEALWRRPDLPGYDAYLAAQFHGPNSERLTANPSLWRRGLGTEILREQIIQSLVPTLPGGAFGPVYGSHFRVANTLLAQRGSLIDPSSFPTDSDPGRAEYRLANALEDASRAFRLALPPDSLLWVGISPLPDSRVGPRHPQVVQAMLRTWADWLQADRVLTDLPPVLPQDRFATPTHLNARAIPDYTAALANLL